MISVVMTAYKRADLLAKTLESIKTQSLSEEMEVIVVEDGDDGGATKRACEGYAKYFQKSKRPDVPYRNPASVINVGLRRAAGEFIVIQNAECYYVEPGNSIDRLVAPVRESHRNVAFASVMALNPDGSGYAWYCHPQESARPFFFCGAIHRSLVEQLRGMDEDFTGYGFDDDNFAIRMQFAGARFIFTDVRVNHQWHVGTNCYGLETNAQLFNEKVAALVEGRIGVEANVGREWGSLDS